MPPEPFLGMDLNWPKKSYRGGTEIQYSCPYKKITNEELLSGIISDNLLFCL